jgi:membrane-associated protease RseP (regulator of RpoE activity)
MACRASLRATAVLAAASLLLQGCASPGTAVTQSVRVETPGCATVSCELGNDRGSWQLARTPGTVTLTTSHAPLKVSCRADNGAAFSFSAPSSVAPASGAGGVVGGVAGGVGVGAIFGAAALTFIPALGILVVLTGVAAGASPGQALEEGQRPIQYPELLTIPLSCPEAGATPAPTGAGLGLGIRGLALPEARAAGLGERGGVLVTTVADGSPAAAAGLRSGDIILSAAAQELGDARDMEQRVIVLAPGATLTLRIWRDGQMLELVLTRPPAAP